MEEQSIRKNTIERDNSSSVVIKKGLNNRDKSDMIPTAYKQNDLELMLTDKLNKRYNQRKKQLVITNEANNR